MNPSPSLKQRKKSGSKEPQVSTSSCPLQVLFVVSECAPFSKAGGLADVAASLPKALHRMGHEVRIVMPLYAAINRQQHKLTFKQTSCVHMGQGEENWIGVWEGSLDGRVPVWFVDYERFFGRPGIYDHAGGEYGDNAFRFALLSKAAMQICKDLRFIPDVMHVHDWPTALVPVFLKTWDRVLSPLSATASVLTIHNVSYQGIYHAGVYPYLGIGWEHFTADKMESYGKVNLLKSGIAFADAITTVSPAHAAETLAPFGGFGLAPYLQARCADYSGILNGADYDHWNPEKDALLPARYSAADLSGKRLCKAAVQQTFGLEQRSDWPLFGVISRFAPQKGFNLLQAALPDALQQMNFQLAVLGSGDPNTERFFNELSAAWPGRVGCYIGYSNERSHLIEAGSDFFVMPSLYEPCGLNHIYSMKYGSLPVVRATGGLGDTVTNFDETTGQGTGFTFQDPTPQALRDVMGWAVATWFDRPQRYAQLQQQAMAKNFSWDDSAHHYVNVYRRAIRNRRRA